MVKHSIENLKTGERLKNNDNAENSLMLSNQ